MQVSNSYERDVFNDDLGVVDGISMDEGELSVTFDGREVVYGFGHSTSGWWCWSGSVGDWPSWCATRAVVDVGPS